MGRFKPVSYDSCGSCDPEGRESKWGCLMYKRPRSWSLQGLENPEFGVYLVKGDLCIHVLSAQQFCIEVSC